MTDGLASPVSSLNDVDGSSFSFSTAESNLLQMAEAIASRMFDGAWDMYVLDS